MRTLSAVMAVIAGLGAAVVPGAVLAQDALGDAVTRQQQQSEVADTTDGDLPEPVLLTDDELDDLVAPVALYPDALLAQVLVAATYPLQVVEAERFITASKDRTDAENATELEGKTWDPSVLVLASGFPTVVQRMSDDLEWTEKLGRAMTDQDDDVLAAVQRKRAEAKETGYLADNAAQKVETGDDGSITIAPADPKVVYVPTYDSHAVYTTRPTAQPYIAPVEQASTTGLQPNPLVTGALAFGAAFLAQKLFGGNDDDDNDDGWDDYWHRRQFDWRDRQFYPRPGWQQADDRRDHPWGWERDRYWDPRTRRWGRDGELARRAYDDDRRDTLGWMVVRDPERPAPWVRGFRPDPGWQDDRALRAAERQAAERRQARLDAERREDRRARQAEEQREARLAERRREERQRAQAAQRARAERQQEATAARRHEERQKAILDHRARLDAQAKADADARAKAQAERREKAEADARTKAQAERRTKAQADAKAKAEADARTKAQADRRAKAEADARAKAQVERRAKAQADTRAKAVADQRARAQANAKAKADADRRQRQAERRAKQKCRPNDDACREAQ